MGTSVLLYRPGGSSLPTRALGPTRASERRVMCPPWNLDFAYSICAQTPSRRALPPVSGSLARGTGLTFQAQIVVAVDRRVDRPL